MINNALKYIKVYLSDLFTPADGWTVELGAITKEGQSGQDLLITLIHIEEERSAKMQDIYHYIKDEQGKTTAIKKQNPEMIFNLYVLISSHAEEYETALSQISRVIEIFQAKNTFEKEEIKNKGITGPELLVLDLYPLTFDQNNSLWQTLGATMMPSVMYKVRSIVIRQTQAIDEPFSDGIALIFGEIQTKKKEKDEEKDEEKITVTRVVLENDGKDDNDSKDKDDSKDLPEIIILQRKNELNKNNN